MSHILILEPDQLLAGSLEDYFAYANYSTVVHSDPQQAVIAADQRRPDVIITELQLAGRSGAEFLYELRSYPDWHDIPLIIFTNLHSQQVADYKDVFEELEVAACLHKKNTTLPQLLALIQAQPVHAKV